MKRVGGNGGGTDNNPKLSSSKRAKNCARDTMLENEIEPNGARAQLLFDLFGPFGDGSVKSNEQVVNKPKKGKQKRNLLSKKENVPGVVHNQTLSQDKAKKTERTVKNIERAQGKDMGMREKLKSKPQAAPPLFSKNSSESSAKSRLCQRDDKQSNESSIFQSFALYSELLNNPGTCSESKSANKQQVNVDKSKQKKQVFEADCTLEPSSIMHLPSKGALRNSSSAKNANIKPQASFSYVTKTTELRETCVQLKNKRYEARNQEVPANIKQTYLNLPVPLEVAISDVPILNDETPLTQNKKLITHAFKTKRQSYGECKLPLPPGVNPEELKSVWLQFQNKKEEQQEEECAQRPVIYGNFNRIKPTAIQNICDQNCYRIIEQIGKGSFGSVYKAIENCSERVVALKRVRANDDPEGCALSAIREIKTLCQLQHKNVISLYNVFMDMSNPKDGFICLVFDYVEHDLFSLVVTRQIHFNEVQIASIVKQLLEGLQYCHNNNVLHRDIKSTNILISQRGTVKLADFGLARIFEPFFDTRRQFTNKVVTLWYRSPELLLGEECYGSAIDVWSCGCIIAEIFLQKPLFIASTEMAILELITRLCGTPEPDSWPNVVKLPYYPRMKEFKCFRRRLRDIFAFLPKLALDILDGMLQLNPDKRLCIGQALQMAWLKNVRPERIVAPNLPLTECHEYYLKKNDGKIGIKSAWMEY